MKHTLFYILLIAFLGQNSWAQDNCSTFYPLQEGVSMEYTSFDKKGKEEGTMTYTVKNVNTNGDTTSATMTMHFEDKKGNEISTEYGVACKGDAVHIDFKSLMNEQMLGQFQEMEVEVTGKDIELPNNLNVGQTLPDGNVNVKVSMAAGMNMNMDVTTTNRKVEKKETVTTPAGTFDCYVLYSETKTKMMMANKAIPTRVWFSEGVGMVKEESYNKNGKLLASSELTKISR